MYQYEKIEHSTAKMQDEICNILYRIVYCVIWQAQNQNLKTKIDAMVFRRMCVVKNETFAIGMLKKKFYC